MIFWFLVFAILALVAYNVVVYLRTSGTVAQRLAAAWKDSMTIFALIWTGVVSALTNGMDAISNITGDPKFAQVGDAIKAAVPANYGQWVVVGTLLLPIVAGVLARQRTLGK